MKRMLFAFFIAALLFVHSQDNFAQVQKPSQSIKQDKSIPLPLQASTKSFSATSKNYDSKSIEDFTNKYGKWSFSFDPSTGSIHRAFGEPIRIKGFESINKSNVKDAALAFLRENAAFLKININDLKFVRATEVNNRFYVSFTQTHEGLDVLLSEIELRIFKNGNIMAFGADFYNDINVATTPTITSSRAASVASADIAMQKSDKVLSNDKLYILPVKTGSSVDYRLVYKVTVQTSRPYAKYVTYVDAHKANIVWRYNQFHNANMELNIEGSVKMKTALDTLAEVKFPHMYVYIDNQMYTGDKDGKVTLNSNKDTVSVYGRMTGEWANVTVIDSTSYPNAVYEGKMDKKHNTIIWNDDNSHRFERILYYHTNYIHDYFAHLDTAFHGMDFPMAIGILFNSQMGSNAGSSGDNIIFYGAEDENYKFAESPSVLYHEYGHSVNYFLYQEQGSADGMINLTANEGTADITSAILLDSPDIAKGTMTSQMVMRCVKNNNIYPDSLEGESHHDGLILSGAFWDLRETASLPIVEKLVHFSRYGTPDDPDVGVCFSEWFMETLIADDDDGNIANGTPHSKEIIAAFNKHHIGTGLFMATSFAHEPLPDTQDTVNAYVAQFKLNGLAMDGCTPDSVRICYTTDNFRTVSMADAVSLGNGNYKAEIAPQGKGNVVRYYFTAKDPQSNSIVKLSRSIQALKPFEFIIGYRTAFMDDMEQLGKWTIGDKSDNATYGKWELDDPNSIDGTAFGSPDLVIQTGDDHTEHGTKCFVTGAKGSIYDYMNSINPYAPNGRTSIISPEYDISNLYKPVIKFYRWFYNNIAAGAPSKSYWETDFSSDGGKTWRSAELVMEPTDKKWDKVILPVSSVFSSIPQTIRLRIWVNVPTISGYPLSLTEALFDDLEILTANDEMVSAEDYPAENAGGLVNIYPNPFSDRVTINYNLPVASSVSLKIFNLMGQEVASLVDSEQNAGSNSAKWNALDFSGNKMQPGLYIYKLQFNGCSISGKLMLK